MSAKPRAEEAAEHRLAARVTEHELEQVRAAAARRELTVSDFIRDVVLHAATKVNWGKARSVTRIKK